MYGWSYPVQIKEVRKIEDVASYYKGMGVLTTLSYFLKLEDLIFDNIISTNGKIALIDLENSFCLEKPTNNAFQFLLSSDVGKKFYNSVINSGIIPRYTVGDIFKHGNSDGSLSIQDIGPNYHIPVLNSEPQQINKHIDSFFSGFDSSFNYFLSNKNILIDFIEKCKKQYIKTRILYRPTEVYAKVLKEMFRPYYLTSYSNRDELLNSLYNGTLQGIPKDVIKSEISQICKFDIPSFNKVFYRDNAIYDFGMNRVCEDAENDYLLIRNIINNSTSDDQHFQSKIIRDTFKIFFDYDPQHIDITAYLREYTSPDETLKSLLQYLCSRLSINDTGISLIDIVSDANNYWQPAVVGPGLSSGLDGIAMVFFTYGYLFDEEEYTEIAVQILNQSYGYFKTYLNEDSYFETISPILVSPNHFPISILYLNEHFHNVSGQHVIPYQELKNNVSQFIKKNVHRDVFYDFLVGSCGLSFLLYQLYEKYSDNDWKELFKICVDHIKDNAEYSGEYAFWNVKNMQKLGGFSHGNSSLSLSMLLASKLLGKDGYYSVFERALRYDRSLYNAEKNGYLDLRYIEKDKFSFSWAHGTGGVGLSRLLVKNMDIDYFGIDNEIQLCSDKLNEIIQSGFDSIYNYNGGFIGIFEVSQLLNDSLNCPEKIKKNNIVFENFLRKIHLNPSMLLGEKNHLHLFMNQGLAGLSYSILRYIKKEEIPLFLTFEIDQAFH